MQAYVINLARAPDRRAFITAELARTRTPYEFVDAVDGRELDFDDSSLIDPAVHDGSFRLGAGIGGAAGCALSHLGVYRKVIEDGLERALILEDDVSLPSDLAELAESVGQQLVGAEVALLCFHSNQPCRVTRSGSVGLPSGRLLVDPVDVRQLGSTGAYVITREACVRMARTVLPVRVPADDWHFFCREGATDRVRCVVPMPVADSPKFRSTIDYYPSGSWQARVRETIAARRIPILSQAIAYRRRHSFRRMGFTGQVEFVEQATDRPEPQLKAGA